VASSGLDLTGLLRPVREGNAFEETVERLLTVIKLGVVGPGERFPAERELAAQLGISRPTLREAIRELQQAGYVESRRGRSGGTFVTGASWSSYWPSRSSSRSRSRALGSAGAKRCSTQAPRLVGESQNRRTRTASCSRSPRLSREATRLPN